MVKTRKLANGMFAGKAIAEVTSVPYLERTCSQRCGGCGDELETTGGLCE